MKKILVLIGLALSLTVKAQTVAGLNFSTNVYTFANGIIRTNIQAASVITLDQMNGILTMLQISGITGDTSALIGTNNIRTIGITLNTYNGTNYYNLFIRLK